MDIEYLRSYCLSLPETSESMPFDDKVLVFKVTGKLFALTNIVLFESVNLKCDPIEAVEYRERYNAVEPGYHMNKKHWNTVSVNRDVPDNLLLEMVDKSYFLVVNGLKKTDRERVLALNQDKN